MNDIYTNNDMKPMNKITLAKVIARPIGTRRQALISYGDTHVVVGSPKIRDTVSEQGQPLDLLLAALASDCVFTCQDTAQRHDIPLYSVTATTSWTSSGEQFEIVVRLAFSGPGKQQTDELINAIKANSKTYQLLIKAVDVTLEVA